MTENNYALITENLGRRMKTVVESSEKVAASFPSENKARQVAGNTSPVEIIGTWVQDDRTWKCRAKRLWRIDGVYQTRHDEVEFDLYHPTSTERPPQGIGERVFAVFRGVWELVSGASSGTPSGEITVPVFYPARQAGCENAHGLTNEGIVPFEAGDGLYYKNIRPVVKERFIQPDGNKWQFEYVDETPCTIEDVALEYANQTMTGWDTTDDVNLALKYGHRLIIPHDAVGYTLGNNVTFTDTGGVVIPKLQKEFPFAPIFAEVDVTLRKQDGTVIETIEDLIEAGQIKADLPEYQNNKPLVKDTKSIENNCDGKPLLGLWRDGIFPQLLYCENIPYGYCIPLQTITHLVKTTCDDCSPVYNPNKYTVALQEAEGNTFFVPLNVDYKPSIRCQ